MVIDVLHPSRPNVSKTELSEKLATLYKADKARVVTFGFKTHFGGGRSTGFALIYDDEVAHKRFEPRYRLVRVSQCVVFAFAQKCLINLSIHLIGWHGYKGGEGVSQVAQGA
jgi:ribosomal protein S24E